MGNDDVSSEKIKVRLPAELPPLTPTVCRELLAILVELTADEILDSSTEGPDHGRGQPRSMG